MRRARKDHLNGTWRGDLPTNYRIVSKHAPGCESKLHIRGIQKRAVDGTRRGTGFTWLWYLCEDRRCPAEVMVNVRQMVEVLEVELHPHGRLSR